MSGCTYTLKFTKICILKITNKIHIVFYSFTCSFFLCQLETFGNLKFGHCLIYSHQQQYLIAFSIMKSVFLICTTHFYPEKVISHYIY